jgi:hypothetical protein
MRQAVNVVLIVGFVMLDWLRFHDILKPGETPTAADWLTGSLSILVFYVAINSLVGRTASKAT